jgi:hypothetical protein
MLLLTVNVLPCAGYPSDVVITNHCTSSNLLEIVYGLVQLKYVNLMFTNPGAILGSGTTVWCCCLSHHPHLGWGELYIHTCISVKAPDVTYCNIRNIFAL